MDINLLHTDIDLLIVVVCAMFFLLLLKTLGTTLRFIALVRAKDNEEDLDQLMDVFVQEGKPNTKQKKKQVKTQDKKRGESASKSEQSKKPSKKWSFSSFSSKFSTDSSKPKDTGTLDKNATNSSKARAPKQNEKRKSTAPKLPDSVQKALLKQKKDSYNFMHDLAQKPDAV